MIVYQIGHTFVLSDNPELGFSIVVIDMTVKYEIYGSI